MLEFQLCHSKKDPLAKPFEPQGLTPFFRFETCLRKIWISAENTSADASYLRGPEAYRFLLEVIVGLHSPIFGETEIMGQFKTFLKNHALDPDFGFFRPWAKLLQEDAKALRTLYLRGQGTGSYGSLLRKKLAPQETLWILGAGQLTEALLPWLSEQKVTLWARDPAKARRLFPNATLAPLDAQAPEDATVVVAAPLNEQELTSLLEKNPRPWIDLREKTAPCGSNAAARLTLSDLYHEGSQHQDQNSDLRQQILHEIQELAHKRTHQAWFRPQGWEDVCAS